MRRLVLLVAAALCGLAPALTAPAAAQAATCASPVQFTSLTFDPPQAAPGQTSTASPTARNCSDQPQTFSVLTYARFVGTTGGIPPGCPAIDPLPPQQVTLAPGASWTGGTSYLIFPSCTATALEVTARASDSTGATLDTRTADLPITAAPPACAVTYRVSSQWSHGFTAQVTITDTAATAITGWSLGFTYAAGQRVVSAWDATVTQSAAAVTATAMSYNATVTAGGSTTFGLVGTWSGTNPAPAAFTLNGSACQVR